MRRFEPRDLVAAVAASALFLALSVGATAAAGRFAGAIIAAGFMLAFLLVSIVVLRQIQARSDESRELVEASVALYHALQPVAPLPAMRGYALAPDAALLLYQEVRKQRPRVVVETGSGTSSVVIGYALKALGGGHLFSLERDEQWGQRTRELLQLHGLCDYVTVVHAPLCELSVDGHARRWHDASALGDVQTIDLVFDDGPPRVLGPHLRDAALPVLAPKLSPDAVYVMNFVAAEERRTVKHWLERYPEFRAEWLPTKKGNVILRRWHA
jgi:predicted O-methyltransferase YrrM